MADRLEGKHAEARDDFSAALQHLEQSIEIDAATESQTRLETYLARNRTINAVACSLLQEI